MHFKCIVLFTSPPSFVLLSSLSSFPLSSFFTPLIPLLSPQACKERELSQAQLKAFSQQTEGVRRELAEVLGRLAQSEEEVLRKDVELSETRARHLGLEQEVREASIALEEEAQRQSVLQAWLRE